MERSAPRANRLYAFKCGTERVTWGLLDAEHPTPDAAVDIPHFRYVITHPSGVVMYDTGGDPTMQFEAYKRVPAEYLKEYDLTLGRDEVLDAQLAAIGLSPHDVSDVALSHLHWDHAGCLGLLTRARLHLQKAEYTWAMMPCTAHRVGYIPDDYVHATLWNLVDGDFDLYGDGAIVAVSTPGHTPGHQSLIVRLSGRTVLITGDAAYDRDMMRSGKYSNFYWDYESLVNSRNRLLNLLEEYSAELVVTHDRKYLENVRLAPEQWYE